VAISARSRSSRTVLVGIVSIRRRHSLPFQYRRVAGLDHVLRAAHRRGRIGCRHPERRAVMIKGYLVDNFQLSPTNLRTVGFGKSIPKNKIDPNAPENRRVEVVNLAPQAQARR
jgi:hypothetical protein